MKIFVVSFNRASNHAIQILIQKMKKEDVYTDDLSLAEYVLAVGDRSETFYFVLHQWSMGKKIIHLWAGDVSQGTQDEVYRHSMTLMSMMQLCTTQDAARVVTDLCCIVGKTSNVFVVGNLMLDDMRTDESFVPLYPFNLVLYNPSTLLHIDDIKKEIKEVYELAVKDHMKYVWIQPNGDQGSELLDEFVTHPTLPRSQFLGLLKQCSKFITNSSSAYYEAPFLIDRDQIVLVGERNKDRNAMKDMCVSGASDRIMKIFQEELS